MPTIDINTREEIIKLHRNGQSQVSIASQCGVSRCAIQKIIKKENVHGTVRNLSKQGRPKN